jgi:hypothetical protein
MKDPLVSVDGQPKGEPAVAAKQPRGQVHQVEKNPDERETRL